MTLGFISITAYYYANQQNENLKLHYPIEKGFPYKFKQQLSPT